MPNQVTSVNDFTLFKALKALMRDDSMNFEDAQAAIERLREAGLLIREPAEKEEPKKALRGSDDKPDKEAPASN